MQPIKADDTHAPSEIAPPPLMAPAATWLRWFLCGLGLLLVGIGIVGVFLPVLPTTVFLIAALWAFSKSSAKFQAWLWYHPSFGGPVRDWHQHRVIGVRAKVFAVLVMTLSFLYVTIWVADDWQLPVILSVAMLPAGLYVATRPSHPPTITKTR